MVNSRRLATYVAAFAVLSGVALRAVDEFTILRGTLPLLHAGAPFGFVSLGRGTKERRVSRTARRGSGAAADASARGGERPRAPTPLSREPLARNPRRHPPD